MFSLNISNDEIYFRNAKLTQIQKLHKWYNRIDEYKFATGVNSQISFDDMLKEYFNILSSKEEFFAAVYNLSNEMVGILKGRFILNKKVVWIKVLIIKTQFQGRGYGKKAVDLLLDYFIKKDVKNIYLTVAKQNKMAYNFWIKQGFGEVKEIKKYINLSEENFKLLVWQKDI